ncbi:phosphoenolpyruvate carboxykinase (ATP) [Acidiphilium sp.]|uniref:phosphoenolpyruvate carboxykinase (ATP) n=1 Tax=Acidiphilium sp. TaxID=527 RepID=UPI003D0442B2
MTAALPAGAAILDQTVHNAAFLACAGIGRVTALHANLTAPALVTHAIRRGEGRLSADGALIVQTGLHTGRSAGDKFVVDEPATTRDVWWGKVNQKLSAPHFATLKGRVQAYLQDRELYSQDLFAGADPDCRIRLRLITTNAWQALFARNMFIRPSATELAGFEPDYVILHAPDFEADPAIDGVASRTAIALSFAERRIVIAGTHYAGEIKKSIFTVMNWLLPERGVLPMHCSANIGGDGDVALFFGLSGTGKTTLSSDPERRLIGDDEHGWGPNGVFNFEGGCYAKVIDLEAGAEPEIYAAAHRFGTVLENVVADPRGVVDLADRTLTENTRACYPIDFIPHVEASGRGGQPRHVVMLTADAFGVLPPLARLTPAQAMYHFLSGYTAKVAGTETGLGRAPQATFSTCFGAPFLPREPRLYGALLARLIAEHGVSCWLVNTGWSGGAYGAGRRMPIAHTRALLHAALSGALDHARFRTDAAFGLMIPVAVPGVPDDLLDPRAAWVDPVAYDRQAAELIRRFEANFARFADAVDPAIRAGAIRSAA